LTLLYLGPKLLVAATRSEKGEFGRYSILESACFPVLASPYVVIHSAPLRSKFDHILYL